MELTFLGTSCMVPTKERNTPGIFLDFKGEGILFDCGEGSQRQMNIAGINRNRVKKVLLSHWHGDHVAGLIGLIQTLGNEDRSATLTIYGPAGTKERLNHLMQAVAFDLRVNITVHELKPKGVERFFENKEYALECVSLQHSVPCLGFSFIEKERLRINMQKAKAAGLKEGPLLGKLQAGQAVTVQKKTIRPEDVSYKVAEKKLTIILDTEETDEIIQLAKDADLLIIEATYTSAAEEKAEQYRHLTAKQAALIAQRANVKRMIMTHFSQRYKIVDEFLEEAQTYFPESSCAYDFMKVNL
ncbi:MAG: ribonuclease Z [Nanoarchaeota archaeon]